MRILRTARRVVLSRPTRGMVTTGESRRMSRFAYGLGVAALALVVAACRSHSNEPVFQTATTVKEVMKLMVEPSADALWNAVAINVTTAGTEVKAPETDQEWTDVR